MFRFAVRGLIALATIATLGVGVAPAQAAPVSAAAPIVVAAPTTRLVDIDTQEFRRFDRVILRFRGGVPDIRARYVRFAVDQDGDVVRLPGRHLLLLRVEPVRARSLDQGVVRVEQRNLRAFRLIEDRRGVVRIALGLRDRVGVRVIELPNRLIIDIPSHNRPVPF